MPVDASTTPPLYGPIVRLRIAAWPASSSRYSLRYVTAHSISSPRCHAGLLTGGCAAISAAQASRVINGAAYRSSRNARRSGRHSLFSSEAALRPPSDSRVQLVHRKFMLGRHLRSRAGATATGSCVVPASRQSKTAAPSSIFYPPSSFVLHSRMAGTHIRHQWMSPVSHGKNC